MNDLNNVKEIEKLINNKFSTYQNSISYKDKNYVFISETLESNENSLEKINKVLETVRPLSHIEAYAKLDSWDADPEIDGVNINFRIYSTPYGYLRGKGLLKVKISNQNGNLIESYTKELDVNDFNVGTCGNEEKFCGYIREIRFNFKKSNNLGGLNFGRMEVTFETQGKSFEAVDKAFN